MRSGIYGRVVEQAKHLARNYIYLADPVYLVSEELYSYSLVAHICGYYIHRVALNSEVISFKREIVAVVADGNELSYKIVSADSHSGTHR